MAYIHKIKVGSTTYDVVDKDGRYEANLQWGGKNLKDSYAPIDAAMIPNLGANRLAFTGFDNEAAIIIEYSRDNGVTWTDYGATKAQKVALFNGNGASLLIGKSSTSQIATNQCLLRVTLNTGIGKVYTILNKFVLYISTNGSTDCWCTIKGRLQSNYEAGTDTWTTFVNQAPISGWSGYNIINTNNITTYGNQKASQFGQLQFIFGCGSQGYSTYSGLTLQKILGYGGVGWTTPSTMAADGHMYTYDANKKVTFDGVVNAKGNLQENGTALSVKYLGINATAAKATADANGNNIANTYYKASNPSGYQTSQQVDDKINSAIGSAIADIY